MSRIMAREAAMKLIYQMELTGISHDEALKSFLENEENVGIDEEKYIKEIVYGVGENISLLDSYIEKYAKGWSKHRIAKVDISILRLALYEMLKKDDVPNSVAINEAVELAKKYSSDNSPSFINGILASVLKEL